MEAERVLSKEPQFVASVLDVLAQGNVEGVVKKVYEKSRDVLRAIHPDELIGLAFCLFTMSVQDLEIDETLKKKMARTIKMRLNRIARDFKPTDAVKEVVKRVEKKAVEVGSKVLGAAKEVTGAAVDAASVVAERVAEVKEKKKKKKKAAAAGEEADAAAVEEAAPPSSIADNLLHWLKMDSKVRQIIHSVQVVDDNTVRVEFDPESEGYVARVELQASVTKIREETIVQLLARTPLDFRYFYDVAIGFSHEKKLLATSLSGPADDDESIQSEIDQVTPGNQLSWDRAMIALNNDKKLLKKIRRLELVSPAPELVSHVFVPVKILRGETASTLEVRTFLTRKLKPSHLILGVLEGIAEDLDFLSQVDASEQDRSLATGSLFTVETTAPTEFRFKHLPKDPQVQVKLCPNCRKPLAPDAEYYRCPHCLAKLK